MMRISWRQFAKDHPRLVDAALIVLLLAGAAGPAELNSNMSGVDTLGWRSAVPLAVAACLALLWRRSHPRSVVVVTAFFAAAAGGVGYLITPVLLAPVMVALYELAVRVPSPTARRYSLAVMVWIIASALLGDRYGNPWPLTILNSVLFLLVPVILGETARLRQHSREEEARHHVAEERIRIARELHDVVAHHLALANAQAGTAAYLSRTRPDQVQQILTELSGTTSAALRELKATVGVLRNPGDNASPLEPVPGLAQLPQLTAACAAAGLDVTVTVDGRAQPLPPDVDLTAFRIVQEALTNVSKHATTTAATVLLSYGHGQLTVTVTNAADSAPAREGFGLLGMRERAQAIGGRLRVGPHPDGAFTVTAELPVRTPAATSP